MARKTSRFYKNLEKKSKKNLFISIIGIVLLLLVLLRFGIPILADVSFFIGQLFQNQNEESITSDPSFLPAPILDPIPSSTNSAILKISGNSKANNKVAIFLNGKEIKEEPTDSKGAFESTLSLSEGENIIRAKTRDRNHESDFSNNHFITLKMSKPRIELERPQDGESTSQRNLEILGKTDLGNKVFVNGFWAMVEGENFSYRLELNNGENEISIRAEDNAGNYNEIKIMVLYNP